MQLRQTNPRKQGDIGVAHAIAWFTENGYRVLVPLSESQPYDLAVDDGTALYRVQVKTTTCRNPRGRFMVTIATRGGNRSGESTKFFDPAAVEFLFVLTADGERYLFPAEVIKAKGKLCLGAQVASYKVP